MAENKFFHPKFSFMNNAQPSFAGVPIPPAECVTPVNACLPLSSFQFLRFQVLATEFNNSLLFDGNKWGYVIYPVKGANADCTIPDDYFSAIDGFHPPYIMRANVYSSTSMAYTTSTVLSDIPSPYVGVLNFEQGLIDMDAWNAQAPPGYEINTGDCFRLQVWQAIFSSGGELITIDFFHPPVFCSPCFVRTELCYNSVITYKCNENSYGFFFNSADEDYNAFHCRIELPFYLKNPQLPGEEKSYRKADGSYIKLSERIEEEYQLETDWMLHDWHRKLKVALGCDTVSIRNPNMQQQGYLNPGLMGGQIISVVCREDYSIEWPEEAPDGYTLTAKAKTKVRLSEPVAFTNSNCQ